MKKHRSAACTAAAALLTVLMIFSGCGEKSEESSAQQSVQSSIQSSAEQSPTDADIDTPPEDSSQGSDDAEKTEDVSAITPRVCEISDSEGHKLYTMGTIHLADESVTDMPGYFEAAFAASDSVAVECDTSVGGLDLLSVTKLMYTDRTTIKDHVSAEDYEKVKAIVESSPYYSQVYDYIKPMMWASLAETTAALQAGLSESYGVDNMLISRAGKEGKPVLEVEGTDAQMQLIADMPEEIQNMVFHEIAAEDDYIEVVKKELHDMYESWKKGEELASEEEASDEAELSEEQKALLEKYNSILLYDRNVGMADKAEEYLRSGDTVFMAVGAAHFYGEKGIYRLLEKRGYKIRQLTAEDGVQTEYSVTESTEVSENAGGTDPAVPRAA